MTIIEAIQKAEAGYPITNETMDMAGQYLKYIAAGFYELYSESLLLSKDTRLDTVSSFTHGQILDTSWKIYKSHK